MTDLIATDVTWGTARAKLNALANGTIFSNRRVAAFGDSITQQNYDSSSTGKIFNGKGYMGQARAIAMNCFDFDGSLNFGVAGNTTAQMLARIGDVVAARPARVFILGGTNNRGYGASPAISVAQTEADLITMFDTFAAEGIYSDWCPILPRSFDQNAGGTYLVALQNFIHSVNHRVRRHIRNRADGYVTCVPLDYYLTDRTSSTGVPMAGTMTPEPTGNGGLLHPRVLGAQFMAIPLAAYYAQIFPLAPRNVTANNDVFNATDNPDGAIRSNPLMTGNTGTAGAGMTASGGGNGVATGWNILRYQGSTVTGVVSKVSKTAPNGAVQAEEQSIVLGGGTAGAAKEVIRVIQAASSVPSTGLNVGDQVALVVEVEQINLVNVQNINARLYGYRSDLAANYNEAGLGGTGETTDREVPNLVRRIETPPFTIVSPGSTAGTNDTFGVTVQIECDCTGAGVSGEVRIRSIEFVKKAPAA